VSDSTSGERQPLPPAIYAFVQWLLQHGIAKRYLPLRQSLLAWDRLPDQQILEIGCGTGAFSKSRGFGLDLDLARVRVVTSSGRPGIVADGRYLPFADRTFRLVYCEGVLHHVDDQGAISMLREMLRVCQPGGHVFFMDSVWPRSRLRIVPYLIRRADFGRHVRHESQLRELLELSGADIKTAERIQYNTIGLECLAAHLHRR
jgi:ubiquinone/menaquinone biosynthesis C-methylase UbiE